MEIRPFSGFCSTFLLMVTHPKHDGPYLTMALVICDDNNELVYHACVCKN